MAKASFDLQKQQIQQALKHFTSHSIFKDLSVNDLINAKPSGDETYADLLIGDEDTTIDLEQFSKAEFKVDGETRNEFSKIISDIKVMAEHEAKLDTDSKSLSELRSIAAMELSRRTQQTPSYSYGAHISANIAVAANANSLSEETARKLSQEVLQRDLISDLLAKTKEQMDLSRAYMLTQLPALSNMPVSEIEDPNNIDDYYFAMAANKQLRNLKFLRNQIINPRREIGEIHPAALMAGVVDDIIRNSPEDTKASTCGVMMNLYVKYKVEEKMKDDALVAAEIGGMALLTIGSMNPTFALSYLGRKSITFVPVGIEATYLTNEIKKMMELENNINSGLLTQNELSKALDEYDKTKFSVAMRLAFTQAPVFSVPRSQMAEFIKSKASKPLISTAKKATKYNSIDEVGVLRSSAMARKFGQEVDLRPETIAGLNYLIGKKQLRELEVRGKLPDSLKSLLSRARSGDQNANEELLEFIDNVYRYKVFSSEGKYNASTNRSLANLDDYSLDFINDFDLFSENFNAHNNRTALRFIDNQGKNFSGRSSSLYQSRNNSEMKPGGFFAEEKLKLHREMSEFVEESLREDPISSRLSGTNIAQLNRSATRTRTLTDFDTIALEGLNPNDLLKFNMPSFIKGLEDLAKAKRLPDHIVKLLKAVKKDGDVDAITKLAGVINKIQVYKSYRSTAKGTTLKASEIKDMAGLQQWWPTEFLDDLDIIHFEGSDIENLRHFNKIVKKDVIPEETINAIEAQGNLSFVGISPAETNRIYSDMNRAIKDYIADEKNFYYGNGLFKSFKLNGTDLLTREFDEYSPGWIVQRAAQTVMDKTTSKLMKGTAGYGFAHSGLRRVNADEHSAEELEQILIHNQTPIYEGMPELQMTSTWTEEE